MLATDAQADSRPSGGYLAVIDGDRVGGFCVFPHKALEAMECGGEEDNPITQCEGVMLPLTLLQLGSRLKGRSIVWLVANTWALMSIVKGTSRNKSLDVTVSWFHFLLCKYRIEVWFA